MNDVTFDSDDEELDCRIPNRHEPRSLPPSTVTITAQNRRVDLKKISSDDSSAVKEDFWRKQTRLQAEARIALAQACQMAKMQIEVERQRKKNSPISEMVRIVKRTILMVRMEYG
jgi:hypothetical protein